MCTVTVLPGAALAGRMTPGAPVLRVACNRDELRSRPKAEPPATHILDGRSVLMPRDPEGGGTWIAANDRGLVFVLLNAYPPQPSGTTAVVGGVGPSRGSIVPALASSDSVSEALDRSAAIDARAFRPFRLIVLDRHQLIECWPAGAFLQHRRTFVHRPLVRTSSSLGDALVQAPRRALFRRFFDRAADPRAAQDAFHDHQWPGAEAISVRMERPDARTVSRSVVEVGHDLVRFSYSCLAGDDAPYRLSVALAALPRQSARCS
jgi:hypothetical protein